MVWHLSFMLFQTYFKCTIATIIHYRYLLGHMELKLCKYSLKYIHNYDW